MANNKEKKVLLRVQGLKKYFPLKKTSFLNRNQLYVKANDGISLDIYEGETFGLVGESGCGKSTLGRVILQLYPQTEGSTMYYGRSWQQMNPKYILEMMSNLPEHVRRLEELKKSLDQANDSLKKAANEEDKKKADDRRVQAQKSYDLQHQRLTNVAGGLILAKDLKSVSKLLVDAFHKSIPVYKLTEEIHEQKLQMGLAEEKQKGSGEKFNEKIKELTIKLDSSKLELNKAAEKVENLRAQMRFTPGFDELEKNRDDGIDLAQLTKEEMRVLRRDLQIIFQDPYSSLNPRLTVGQILNEGLLAHNYFKKGSEVLNDYIIDIMEKCGLSKYMVHRYPHQFSGGQRQRIGIARALALNPKFVVCDESVSALDVSIQSQIINLLIDLKKEQQLTYLFISHDLSVVKYISDRIGVMYLGNMAELGTSEDIFKNPLHPYTQALLSAIPSTDDEKNKELILLEGDIPSPINPPKGCKFNTRCPHATERCRQEVPVWQEINEGHFVACHLYNK